MPNEEGENIDLRNHFDGRLDVIFSDGDRRMDVDQFWEMNYHEASIFLEVNFCVNYLLSYVTYIFLKPSALRKEKTMKNLILIHMNQKHYQLTFWYTIIGIMEWI